MIQTTRLTTLNDRPIAPGGFVLYWMQQSQRCHGNHALDYAISQANTLHVPVLVVFGLMDDYPEANLRHYRFMLQGLAEVSGELSKRGIGFVVRHGEPAEVAIDLARDAALVVCDCGYLQHQRRWRDRVADLAAVRVVQVETDAIVPVQEASNKAEFAARTLRPKIHRLLSKYLIPLTPIAPRFRADALSYASDINLHDVDATLARLKIDRSVPPSHRFTGGASQANRLLEEFIKNKLPGYSGNRGEPAAGIVSYLSPYLHFGQISSLEIALAVQASDVPNQDKDGFLEQLIVRRELCGNYVLHTPHYATYDALPAWAKRTLEQHAADPREHLYTRQQLESAGTHDPFWNAAMREMLHTGYMHNYMRMYWGKKVIEWKAHPREAFDDLLYLNNRYFIDGRDPNSYVGVAWCFGLHDRPWTNRPIFGQVRYMNAAGLLRKFDMDAYCRQVDELCRVG